MNPNYAVLKEYALNGGTMTTFTGENTMAAVSESLPTGPPRMLVRTPS